MISLEKEFGQSQYNVDQLHADVGWLLDVEPKDIQLGDDLTVRGIDSIRLMCLIDLLQARGISVKFTDLAASPRLEAWIDLIDAARSKAIRSEPMTIQWPLALSPLQRTYWTCRGEASGLGGIGYHFYVEFTVSSVDTTRLERAIAALIKRHLVLHTRFSNDGVQSLQDGQQWPGMEVFDCENMSENAVFKHLGTVREYLSHRRLDVDQGEVLDCKASRLKDRTIIHFQVDRLAADLPGIKFMLKDLADAYRNDAQLPEPDLTNTIADRMAARQKSRSEGYDRARAYWSNRLDSFPGPLNLTLKMDPASTRDAKFHRRSISIEPAQLAQLKLAASNRNITLPMVLATAYGLVLSRWSGNQHFFISSPVLNRGDSATRVANFTELLLLEMDFREINNFAEACCRQQQCFEGSIRHNEFSGFEVLRELSRRKGSTVETSVLFTDAMGIGELIDRDVSAVLGEPDYMISQTPHTWIDNQVMEHNGELLINWDSVDELFYPDMLDNMFYALKQLLDHVTDSAQWGTELPDLLSVDQRLTRQKVNNTSMQIPQGLLHDGFLASTNRQPEATALCWGDTQQWTYRELLLRVQGIARLLRERGCGIGDRVAITMKKGPIQVAAVLAVSACGATYVPVGVEQPVSRRDRIYRSADIAVLLLDQVSHDVAADHLDWPHLLIGEEVQSEQRLQQVKISPDGLAYIIYTSGSTGEPKGVEITHRAALNTIIDINRRFEVTGEDRVLAVSALDFDLSVYDIFGLLSVGGALVLPYEYERRNPHAWQQLVFNRHVTMWNSVPALLDMLLTMGEADVSSLRLAMLSGDWIGLDLPDRLRERNPGCRLISMGGATEASIWSNWYEVDCVNDDWLSIPYGYPLANQQFRVVDGLGRDCPDWVAGELWIGGEGVALGYRGDEQRTARQFVTWRGQRWYRTGDLGRYWPGGCLEFLGRVDFQVKIRGHRIELGEVENAFRQHLDVADAVALAVGERQPHLAAVVVSNADILAETLREFVGRYLPTYAVPEQVVVVVQMPLTANGKVNRKALLQHCKTQHSQADVLTTNDDSDVPSGPEEVLISRLWSELLGRDDIRRGDHFINLGGDRVLAARFIQQVHDNGFANVTVSDLFKCPELKYLAQLIRLKSSARKAKKRRVKELD